LVPFAVLPKCSKNWTEPNFDTTILEGNTDYVTSVALSSDDKRTVSGLLDKLVPTQQPSLRYIRQKAKDPSGYQRHTGWLLTLEEHYLMFVPLSAKVPDASNILTLPPSYAASVDFTSSTFGPKWYNCFSL
jgi:hypothetical protein